MADTDKCDKKPKCKFGDKCYRRNPDHLKNYSHPKRKNEEEDEQPKKKTKLEHFFKAAPDHADEEKPEPKLNEDEADIEEISDASDDESRAAEENNGDTSGYVRPTGVGNLSGYIRQDEEEKEVETATEEVDTLDKQEDNSEEGDGPASPEDVKESIQKKYLMEMPEDFYKFWEFCKSLDAKNPADALKKSLGLKLVGPYDVLAGKCKKKNKHGKSPCYQRHWRYYYDPPEFMTIIRGDDGTQFHFGYYRDDPREAPVFVASNAASENCTITPRGENVFSAVNWYLHEEIKKTQYKELTKLKKSLTEWAESKDITLDLKTKKITSRQKKVVCKTFHGAGLVVPVDDNEIGYRPVPESIGDLKKMFKRIENSETDEERDKNIDPLQEIITLIQFANDECDYGEGIELGLDLFSNGGETFHPFIMTLLPLGYKLLGRHAYAKIIQEHLADRKRSADLSEF